MDRLPSFAQRLSTSALSRRRFLSVALVGTASAALAACGAPTGQPASAPTAAATAAPSSGAATNASNASKPKITFLAQSGKASEDRDNPVIDKYKQAQGGNVDVVWGGASATEIQQKLLTMIAGGTPPDVFWTHTYINGGLAKRNVPADLNGYIKGDSSFKKDDYYAAALNDFAFGGKQYGLPRETTSTILLYNKTLFDQAKVDPPTADWTWDDFVKAARALTKGDGASKQFGAAGFQQKGYAYYAFIRVWHEGGDVVSEDRTKYTLADDPGVKAMQWIADLVQKDKVHASGADLGGIGADEFFNTGRVAMMPSISVYSAYQKATFEWDIQHLPKSPQGKQITRNASAGHSIVAQSKAADTAWSFVSYLASKDVFEHMAKLGLLIPSHKAVAEEVIGNASGKPKNIKIGLDALGYARPEPVVGDWIGVHGEIATAMEGILGPDQKPVKDSLSGIADRVTALIQKEPKV